MSPRHLIDDCLAENIGEGGIPRAEFEAVLARTKPTLERLEREWRSGTSPLLKLPSETADLAELAPLAEEWRQRFRRVFLIGMGGASLGARTLASALGRRGPIPELVVLDNLDPEGAQILSDPSIAAESGYLVISKSGSTDETLSLALIAVATVERSLGASSCADRFIIIAEPGDNPLRRLAAMIEARVLDHDPEIDGRFSVLSPVGLLPAMMTGLDPAEVRAGAAAALAANLAAGDLAAAPAAAGAAIAVGLNESRGITQTVLMPYSERLRTFTLWYRQLWAESLGKNGKGTTPISALGPNDQHGQLQLYLDGPWDKIFTLITLPGRGTGPLIEREFANTLGRQHLAGRRVGDLVGAMQRATAETLAKRGRPVRLIAVDHLDGATLGALFMHFILETLIAADLLGVDPFGQPAVDEGKALTRHHLVAGQEGNGEARLSGALR